MSSKVAQKLKTENTSEDSGKYIETKVNNFMEKLSIVFLMFILIYFVSLLPSLKEMTYFFFENNIAINFYEYLFLIPGAIVSFSFYKLSTQYLIHKWEPYVSKEAVRQNETPEQRLHRLGDYLYKGIYDSISWGMLLYLTYGSIFVPQEFGGKLNIEKSLEMWPYEVNTSVRIYYMFALGHYFERLYYEATNKKNSSYYTMLFHHLVTILLIFLSFYTRHLMYGIPVMLSMDINDVFLNFARFFRESLYTNLASACLLIMMLSWVYTRIYIYAKYILYGLFFAINHQTPYIRKFFFLNFFFVPALVALFILNSVWFFQIIRVFIWRFVKKDKNLPYEDFKKKK